MKDHVSGFGKFLRKQSKEKETRGIRQLPFPSFFLALLFIGVSVIIAVTIFQFVYLRFQSYRSIEIEGLLVLDKATIISELGLSELDDFADIDSFELILRLKKIPWVEQVQVRKLPPFDIRIVIKERVPIAFFRSKKQILLIDKDFMVLNPLRSPKTWNLPVIVDQKLDSIKEGDMIHLSSLERAVDLMKLLEKNPYLNLEMVSEIDISDPINIQMIMNPRGIILKFGMEDFEQKLINFAYSLPEITKIHPTIKSIDLRYKRRVIVEKKSR